MDKWKICIDSDTATPIDLSETLGITVAVNVGIPSLKYSVLSLTGHQGDIDLSEIYDNQLYYNPRECTVFFISKQGAADALTNINAVLKAYHGKRVRLVNTTQNYMLIGRLTEAEMQSTPTSGNYKLTCKLIAEPLRYKVTETERKNLVPPPTPSNQWATLTAGQTGATATGFSFSGNAKIFSLNSAKNKFYWVKFTNLVNCTVNIYDWTGTSSAEQQYRQVDGTLPFYQHYDTIRLLVIPIDYSKPCSGTVFVGAYEPTVITNAGKSVPLKIKDLSTLNANAFVYLLHNDQAVRLRYGASYNEYPQLMLATGDNYQSLFAESLTYDGSDLREGDVVDIKWREGDI